MLRNCLVLMLVSLLALSGCANTAAKRNQDNYNSYLTAVKDMEVAKVTARATAAKASNSDYDALLARCTSDACVASVASYKAIAHVVESLANNGSNSGTVIQAPQREATFGDKALAWASVFAPVVSQGYNAYQNGKTQRALSADNAALQTAQVNAWSAAMQTVASTPTVSVGGNYGDTYGNDYTGGDRSEVNNSGTLVSGNDNRVASPSTGGNGGNCNGGSGAPGGDSGNAGAGGSGGDASGGAGGTSGSAGNGAPGGNGGNCSGGAGG